MNQQKSKYTFEQLKKDETEYPKLFFLTFTSCIEAYAFFSDSIPWLWVKILVAVSFITGIISMIGITIHNDRIERCKFFIYRTYARDMFMDGILELDDDTAVTYYENMPVNPGEQCWVIKEKGKRFPTVALPIDVEFDATLQKQIIQ